MVLTRCCAVVVQTVTLTVSLVLTGGCQSGEPVSSRRLIEHQALIDFSGLDSVRQIKDLAVAIAPPRRWEILPGKPNPLYTHTQWRSPSTHTGVGVLSAHLPFPLSTKAVIWLAKQEYSKQAKDGKLMSEWTDSLGRSWFEGENEKYHVRGYVVVKGFHAWVIYFGYRTRYAPDIAEIGVAARSADTAVPTVDQQPTVPSVASAQNLRALRGQITSQK